MKTLKFRCKLLSDVILNQKAATEGPNKTLDFIPGSCFLGIVAGNGNYKRLDEKGLAMEIFHSGQVRFGDAHPSRGDVRSYRIPASMFYPKLKKASEECYIHHAIPESDLESQELRVKQLKQCRNGFYIFDNDIAIEVKTDTNFAIKSAYDKDKRRSKDEQMYGYESLQKGLVLYFEVEVQNDEIAKEITDSLVGKDKRIGRSRTAQYGLVEIEQVETYNEVLSGEPSGEYITVYADGRLIFLDKYGIPTFRPTAEQLGLKDGDIIWSKSQIRTFQYTPWNFTRQCFDTDRCGVEKGSVFVVKTSQREFKSQYVGSYKNEGFGRVIYNPEFLQANKKGEAQYHISEEKEESKRGNDKPLKGTVLLNYINKKQNEETQELNVYNRVNNWVIENSKRFSNDSFASQWGAIRSIAMTVNQRENGESVKAYLEKRLYNNGDAYLTHGVAAVKWSEHGRLNAFMSFVKDLTDENAQKAIINLAAEMAKKSKEGK